VQSSSGGDFSAFRIGTTINQTGSADQITRGLFVNPTLTAVASAGFRAVDYPASSQYFLYQGGGTGVTSYIQGAVGIGTGTSTPSAKVHIIGTGATSATTSLLIQNSSALAVIAARDDQRLGVATSSPAVTLDASGGTDGVAIPFGTTAQRPSVNNTIRTNTTAGGMEFRYSGAWHRLTSQVGPSIAAGAAAGTGPTVSINSGNDLCHEVSVTTGTSATTGTLCTVTFGAALDAGLFTYVVFTARNANAAGAIAKFYVGSAGNTSYTIACASAPADGTQYTFHVMVKQ